VNVLATKLYSLHTEHQKVSCHPLAAQPQASIGAVAVTHCPIPSRSVCVCVCGPTSPGRHRLRQWRDDADQRERERLTASAGRLVWSTPRQDNAAEAAAGGLRLVARSACAARDGRNEKVEFNQRRAK